MSTWIRDHKSLAAWLSAAVLSAAWLAIYLTTVSPTVNFIDSGELITALREPGIAHPPGYPLYVLMGYVASHLLWGEEAWRVNALSSFWGALAVGAFFMLVFRSLQWVGQDEPKPASRTPRTLAPKGRTSPSPSRQPQARREAASSPPSAKRDDTLLFLASAAGAATLVGASATFWSRTAQAKMYTLHYFFVATILLLALESRRALDRDAGRGATGLLIATAATLGLSFTNHLMTVLLVVPVMLMLLVGPDWSNRLRSLLSKLKWLLPAFVLPLLLYLYMPWRAAQGPLMNWGSTDNPGDLCRHVSGWQFRPYLLDNIGSNLSRNAELVVRYASGQWGFLTLLVFVGGLLAGGLLWRARPSLFWPTAVFALLTLLFSLFYGISEIEPYVTPFYAALAVWLGVAPASLLHVTRDRRPATRQTTRAHTDTLVTSRDGEVPWVAASLLAAVAVASAIVVYPSQNYGNNRLAEQFALNVFSELPQGSILFTDYWDFYAPTYYLQIVKGVRPDLVIVDTSLLRYPWYTGQLKKRYPWLIEQTADILTTFSREQRRWVNGEPFDQPALNDAYFGLMTAFVERNPERAAFLLTVRQCPPGAQCEENLIAPGYSRVPLGLVSRLMPPGTTEVPVPAEPQYSLAGIIVNPVPFDDPSRENSSRYVDAYRRLAALNTVAQRTEAAKRMEDQAAALQQALAGR